jgi:plastocyanin
MRVLFVGGALAVLLAAPATAEGHGGGGGGGCVQPTSDEATTTVSMSDNCFGPTVARIEPGDTVTFTNDTQLPHTVTAAAMEWGSVDHLPPKANLEVGFDTPGVFPYVCVLHPGMVGAVVVGEGGDAPLAAASDLGGGSEPDAGAPGFAWLILGVAGGLGLGMVGAALAKRRVTAD